MFKLAVFTDEVSQEPERAIKMALEFGLEGVEIRSVWDTPPQNLSDAQVAKLRRLPDVHGLKVCAIASPFLKSNLGDEEGYREHFDILRRCIALGKRLGTNLIRGFTCWSPKRSGDPPTGCGGKTQDTPEVWAEVERQYRAALPVLEAEDAILGIENEADTSACTARLLARFLERINHPRVRAVWDPANEVYAEEGEKPYPDAYLRLKPYLVHVHVKDALRDETGKPRITRVGEGAIDWPGQLQALVEDGYEGWVSLETHWRPVQLSEELIRRPGGRAYSQAAEEASRLCLISLREIVNRLRRR